MKEVFALAAAALALFGYVPYLRDTWRRRIEPHAYTWLVWSLVSAITLGGQIVKGAGVGALPTAFSLIVFAYALRTGMKHITRLDTLFLVAALLGLIPWLVSDDPTLSVLVAVGIDIVAFVPTIRKTWRDPRTEAPHLYAINTLRHVLSLFALEAYNLATASHSVAMVIANAVMTVLVVRSRRNDR
jgi:hypothetical protein